MFFYIFILSLVILFNFYNSSIFCDAPYSNQIGFQDPATPVMEGIIYLHDYIWCFLIFVLIFVSWFLARILILFNGYLSMKSLGACLGS